MPIFVASGVFRGAIGPWPPFGKKNFFDIGKNLENLVWPSLCVSTSGQRKIDPPYEILNTPLFVAFCFCHKLLNKLIFQKAYSMPSWQISIK